MVCFRNLAAISSAQRKELAKRVTVLSKKKIRELPKRRIEMEKNRVFNKRDRNFLNYFSPQSRRKKGNIDGTKGASQCNFTITPVAM